MDKNNVVFIHNGVTLCHKDNLEAFIHKWMQLDNIILSSQISQFLLYEKLKIDIQEEKRT